MGAAWRTGGSIDVVVDAPPTAVYEVVSDVTSTGERSTECRSCEWLSPGPAAPVVGARFRGRNRSGLLRWSRVCEVVAAEPGVRFAFRTVPERLDPTRRDATTWSYHLEPEGSGTRVTHSYEITKPPLAPLRPIYGRLMPQHRDMRPAMEETLMALKRSLEATGSG